jgi:hypothetical protein
MVLDTAAILHYFGRIHSRQGSREIGPQVVQDPVHIALNLAEEMRRKRWGFLHLEAVRIRQTWRE